MNVPNSTQTQSSPQPVRRFSLFWKILLATLVAGLLPLGLLGYNSLASIGRMGATAQESAATELDLKSIEAVRVRAEQAADQISALLESAVLDTRYASSLGPDAGLFQRLYISRQGYLWYFKGDETRAEEVIEQMPLYRELAYIDANGQELLRIVDGELAAAGELRNVADPANTTYLTETYFQEAAALPAGEVYVSPVMAWYTTTPAQPAQALDAPASRLAYREYQAVIRFAAPVYQAGSLQGVVVLSLDHRQIMEVVNHIYSLSGQVAYPDYASGNYAYLLDYEGWLIAHPDLSAVRGLDAAGQLLPSMMNATKTEELPLNMVQADMKAAAREIANNILADQGGNVQALNREGALKVDVYVPVRFNAGVYRQGGVFGGVVISENVKNVEKAGEISKAVIGEAARNVQMALLVVAILSAVALVAAAVLVSRNITRPLLQLTQAARVMEKGELDLEILDPLLKGRVHDEVSELARVFKQMAYAVQLRERRLRQEVEQLRIQIDETKKQQEVETIVQSELFKNLQERAIVLRERRRLRQAGIKDAAEVESGREAADDSKE